MKLKNIAFITFILASFLIFPFLSLANDSTLSGYIESGDRSTAEDYEEEDTDDDYTYQNFHLKYQQKVSEKLSYDISSFTYDKDYKSRDALDNISKLFKTGLSYNIRKEALNPALSKEEHFLSRKGGVKLDLAFKYKEKRYDNTPRNDYDQITISPKLTFTKKDIYTADISAGINSFNYLREEKKDQFKVFAKLGGKRYFLEKKLMLISSYRIDTTEQTKIDRKRTIHNFMGGFDYIFDNPWVYKITTRTGWGHRDTKDEDRDEDNDYEYWQYYAKSDHKINEKLKANLKYNIFIKDYITADLDHRGFYIHQGFDYEVLDDKKQRFSLNLDAEHKDVDYSCKTGNDYKKETVEIKATYGKKKLWKTSASLEGNFYDYNDSTNDKKRYYVMLSGKKLFLENSLTLSLDLKYRYTDNEQRDDIEQKAVRVAFKYSF